jgi:hypothetical protein
MAKYLSRTCPKCNDYLGIAINGQCLRCGYRLAWILIVGRRQGRLVKRANSPFAVSHP